MAAVSERERCSFGGHHPRKGRAEPVAGTAVALAAKPHVWSWQ